MHRIGRYEIRRELGRGGFGRVYSAFDPTVGRMVAIKTLAAVPEPDLLARFRNEASTAGQLRHQNIVTIYDFGEHEGSPYLVMELLEGEDLQSVISKGRMLSTYDKLRILWEIADGLQHAHAHNIIHRDIKPANIMLVAGGPTKLLDFGVAFVIQAAMSRLTPLGNVVGTWRYMAPEQFRGDMPDTLTDIFAFGVVCYELLSGVHPFEADDPGGVMYRIVATNPAPLQERCPELPATLDSVVERMLRKSRDERYCNLDDVKFDLETALLELRRQRVSALLSEAQTWFAAGDLTAAQELVKSALELDRDNALARSMRDQMQRRFQARTEQPSTEYPVTSLFAIPADDQLTFGRISRLSPLPATGTRFTDSCSRVPNPVQVTPAEPVSEPPVTAAIRTTAVVDRRYRLLFGGAIVAGALAVASTGTIASRHIRLQEPPATVEARGLPISIATSPVGAPAPVPAKTTRAKTPAPKRVEKQDKRSERVTAPLRRMPADAAAGHRAPVLPALIPEPPEILAQTVGPRPNLQTMPSVVPERPHDPATPHTPPDVKRADVSSKPAGEQEEIARTLRRYNEAFETRSMPQLGTIWPSMPRDTKDSLRTAFRKDDVHYTVRLTPIQPAQISGDSAVVACERVAKTTARGMSKAPKPGRVEVLLARTGKGWVVREIRDLR